MRRQRLGRRWRPGRSGAAGARVDFAGAAVPRSRGVERQPQSPPSRLGRSAEGVCICDRCGTPMEERHCKIVCPRCYYCRDCSDP